jgi:zinc D-Ala-D-Ala dipeptidase
MKRFPLLHALAGMALATALSGIARPAVAQRTRPAVPATLATAGQMLLVVTAGWDSTTGTLRRYERDSHNGRWTPVGKRVPIVVGRSGIAWDDAQVSPLRGEPVKREGDGRSPAGAFGLDTAFGFDIREVMSSVRLPYLQLRTTTECVDDVRSAHYNTIVDRGRVPRVDWSSAERMREIEQYAFGIRVAYNTPARPARGSCIFLHIWNGPRSSTAGCTAMDESVVRELMGWIDPQRRPVIVQLPETAYRRMRGAWALP